MPPPLFQPSRYGGRWVVSDVERRCGTCRWLNVELDKTGRRVVRKGKPYRCLFEVNWPPLPFAITTQYGFRLPVAIRQGISGSDGADCPTWEAFSLDA